MKFRVDKYQWFQIDVIIQRMGGCTHFSLTGNGTRKGGQVLTAKDKELPLWQLRHGSSTRKFK